MAAYFSRRINRPGKHEIQSGPERARGKSTPARTAPNYQPNPLESSQPPIKKPETIAQKTQSETLIAITAIPPTPAKPATRSQFSVLVAEDNNINRLLLTNQLEGRCQKLTIAKEGNEALKYLLTEHFDLVLLDLQMPGYSGYELIKLVRKSNCINRDTPVIAITAHAQVNQRKQIIEEGFDECLIKPILTGSLDEVIDLWQPYNQQDDSTGDLSYAGQMLNKTNQNHQLALTIFKKLFAELPEQINEIEAALKKQQYQEAIDVTHKLHGSVSFCGLTDIQKPAYALEQCLLNSHYPEIDQNLQNLRESYLRFTGAEQTILAELENFKEQVY